MPRLVARPHTNESTVIPDSRSPLHTREPNLPWTTLLCDAWPPYFFATGNTARYMNTVLLSNRENLTPQTTLIFANLPRDPSKRTPRKPTFQDAETCDPRVNVLASILEAFSPNGNAVPAAQKTQARPHPAHVRTLCVRCRISPFCAARNLVEQKSELD